MNPPPLADLSHQVVEPASPISSRPPAGNLHEFASGSGFAAEDAAAGGSRNRWPREETLALLRVRSEMDATFRDATLKGPLWEHVSRKLGDVGYKRSAKKCREKFENVHKYYKRTKEGRGGRQDGKTYKFFSELEALHATTAASTLPPATTTTTTAVAFTSPSINPTPIRFSAPTSQQIQFSGMFGSDTGGSSAAAAPVTDPDRGGANSFSTNSASSSPTSEEAVMSGRKRKWMMEMFEGVMRRVMEKQEAMQQRFLEAVEKREQERTARYEAWKRQEAAQLSRELEERAASASRNSAIIFFLQQITGQTIQSLPLPPPQLPQQQPPPAAAAVEQQETSGGGGGGSRWPKEEVVALINVRSGLEGRYLQEVGPKGALWEQVSASMGRIGYERSAKRCKEKWENINKYFKKVKESNKKRPEDAKTCPYFHHLDALYRQKTLSVAASQQLEATEPENRNASAAMPMSMSTDLFGESKPEDIVKGMVVDEYDSDDDIIEEEDCEERKKNMGNYKIEFQRQNTTTAAPSFLAMVQ